MHSFESFLQEFEQKFNTRQFPGALQACTMRANIFWASVASEFAR
jgi:hypothetical protein